MTSKFFEEAQKRKAAELAMYRVWQRCFWEHLMRGEADFQANLGYIRYNSMQ